MEEPKFTPYNSNTVPEDLPNSTTVLVLGILSIVLAGFIGVILAIVALNMARTARHAYEDYPGEYTSASYARINAGRICAIVGLSIVGVFILAMVVMLSIA